MVYFASRLRQDAAIGVCMLVPPGYVAGLCRHRVCALRRRWPRR